MTKKNAATGQRVTDAEFIAAARNALPALIAVAKAAREWRELDRPDVDIDETEDRIGALIAAVDALEAL